jgi:hypothetical protein
MPSVAPLAKIDPRIAWLAVDLCVKIKTIGLIQELPDFANLDFPDVLLVLKSQSEQGMEFGFRVNDLPEYPPNKIVGFLEAIVNSVEEEARFFTDFELASMVKIFPDAQLAALLHLTEIGLRESRLTPGELSNECASRLHFLTMVAADLSGSYKAAGISKWFERKRQQLGDRSPADVLHGNWSPSSAHAKKSERTCSRAHLLRSDMTLETYFRQCDAFRPFVWESGEHQASARWHKLGEGPVQYFSDTPDGAWAEFLRHDEIKEPMTAEECSYTFNPVLWSVEVELDENLHIPDMNKNVSNENLFGDDESYTVCQAAALEARENGAIAIKVTSAALTDACGQQVAEGKLKNAGSRTPSVFVYFGKIDAIGWRCGGLVQIDNQLLSRIRHFSKKLSVT